MRVARNPVCNTAQRAHPKIRTILAARAPRGHFQLPCLGVVSLGGGGDPFRLHVELEGTPPVFAGTEHRPKWSIICSIRNIGWRWAGLAGVSWFLVTVASTDVIFSS